MTCFVKRDVLGAERWRRYSAGLDRSLTPCTITTSGKPITAIWDIRHCRSSLLQLSAQPAIELGHCRIPNIGVGRGTVDEIPWIERCQLEGLRDDTLELGHVDLGLLYALAFITSLPNEAVLGCERVKNSIHLDDIYFRYRSTYTDIRAWMIFPWTSACRQSLPGQASISTLPAKKPTVRAESGNVTHYERAAPL